MLNRNVKFGHFHSFFPGRSDQKLRMLGWRCGRKTEYEICTFSPCFYEPGGSIFEYAEAKIFTKTYPIG